MMINIGVLNKAIFETCVNNTIKEVHDDVSIIDQFLKHCGKKPLISNISIIFERLENANIADISEARQFIIDTLSIIRNYKYSDYKLSLFEHKQFAKSIGIKIDDLPKVTELQLAVATLIKNSLLEYNNYNKEPYHKAMLVVIEHITRILNKEEIVETILRTKYYDESMILEESVKLFNEQYAELLKDHKDLFKVMCSNDESNIREHCSQIMTNAKSTVEKVLNCKNDFPPILIENLKLVLDKFVDSDNKTKIDEVSQMLQLTYHLDHLLAEQQGV